LENERFIEDIFFYFTHCGWSLFVLDRREILYPGLDQTVDEGSVELINHIAILPVWKLMEYTLISKNVY